MIFNLGLFEFEFKLCFSVRIALRKNPVVRDRLFTAVLAGAFAHGFYLVYPFISCIFFDHCSYHIALRILESCDFNVCPFGCC